MYGHLVVYYMKYAAVKVQEHLLNILKVKEVLLSQLYKM